MTIFKIYFTWRQVITVKKAAVLLDNHPLFIWFIYVQNQPQDIFMRVPPTVKWKKTCGLEQEKGIPIIYMLYRFIPFRGVKTNNDYMMLFV